MHAVGGTPRTTRTRTQEQVSGGEERIAHATGNPQWAYLLESKEGMKERMKEGDVRTLRRPR